VASVKRWLLAAAAAGLVMPAGVAPAAEPKTFSSVNGTVSSTAVHVIVGTSALPNFRTGAVDSAFPLAHAHVDSSPAAEGVASPADTGPLGQTVATAGPPYGLPTFVQPQYANAKYPPGSTAPVTFGAPPGPSAAATAVLNDATASASAASVGLAAAGPAKPAGLTSLLPSALSRLRGALLAWRARFLTAAAAHRYPMPRIAADTAPDGVFADTASSHAAFDEKAGVLRLNGESAAQSASLAGGMVSLGAVHVKVSVANDGTPKPTVTVDVGRVMVGGVPVSVGHDGVEVLGSTVPGLGDIAAQASQGLNSALATAGFKIFTVTPEITTSTNQVTIDATGVHVHFFPTGAPGGVPQENTDEIIGEVFADSLAVPGVPLDHQVSADTGTAGGATSGGADLGSSGSDLTSGAGGAVGTPATGGGTASLTQGTSRNVAFHHNKPTYLLLLYLMWQILLLGAAASLWWWRQADTA
jgi:hypothetical protein